jgi:hypothetical protein
LPATGTFLLIGQSGRRAHLDFVRGTGSTPAGSSIYAELYTGRPLSFEQAALADYLQQYYPGSFLEVGLSWKDNRTSAGYCDLAQPECLAGGGAVAPELDIVAGEFDEQLRAFGAWMKAHAALRFLVRVDYEVSPLMHCEPGDQLDCPAYAAAFRHIHQLWQTGGITNAELVFHPTRGWAKQMYPGDDVTDWIAFSVFNHDLCLPTPEGTNGACRAGLALDPNLAADLAWAEQQGKPLLIAESTVQSPSDQSAAGFNDYLSRLFELVESRPSVRALTYINMKWSGGWVYGEDWTQGAFGNVDARIARHPETLQFFCEHLRGGGYLALGATPLRCDQTPSSPVLVPSDLDAPVHDRLVLLGSNHCIQSGTAEGEPLVSADCSGLVDNGRARFRIEQSTSAQVWSDVTWRCWSAEGEQLVERPCADVPAQHFQVDAAGAHDLRLVAADGRCVTGPAAVSEPLFLADCGDSAAQLIRR